MSGPVEPLTRGARGIAAAFAISGTVHLIRPEVFTPIVPRWLPGPRTLVLVSGVAELLCAAGLVLPATRRLAGVASAALLVAVLPANVQMAVDTDRAARQEPTREHQIRRIIALARLPLQLPMIRAAWSATRTTVTGR